MIQPGQKLRDGDWCVDMTDFERLELCHEFGVTYMPDKIILFREQYGIFNAKHWVSKCKTEYNFADFKQLCENTFGDGK